MPDLWNTPLPAVRGKGGESLKFKPLKAIKGFLRGSADSGACGPVVEPPARSKRSKKIVDMATIGMFATWALPVLACLVALVTTVNSVRRIRSERQRRLVARAILGTWVVVALLLPVVLLGALGVLPRWTYGGASALMLIASAVGGWIVMRRSNQAPGWR